MSKKKPIDWERIELDYRAGLLSLREIATKSDVSEGAIRKRAKRDSWLRDLSEKVKLRVDDLVRKAEVRNEVRSGENLESRDPIDVEVNTVAEVRSEVRSKTDLSECVLVEATARAIVDVKLSHRSSISRYRALISSLLLEVEQQTGSAEEFVKLAELMAKPDDKGIDRLGELYQKVIALPSRIDSVKKLSETLKILISLEREAFDIAAPVKVEHTGKGGGPIQTEHIDLSKLSDAAIAELMNARPQD